MSRKYITENFLQQEGADNTRVEMSKSRLSIHLEAYAKEQVIKELIWLMGETPVNTDGTPDALDVLVIEERCEKFEQELLYTLLYTAKTEAR